MSGAGERAASPARGRILLIDSDETARTAHRHATETLAAAELIAVDAASADDDAIPSGGDTDVAVIALRYGTDPLRWLPALRAAGWRRVLALASPSDTGAVIDALGHGCTGLLLTPRTGSGAQPVPAGVHEMSARETDIVRLVAEGRSNKWIAKKLQLSALTVKSHLARIGRKLGTGDRAQIVSIALRAGVIH